MDSFGMLHVMQIINILECSKSQFKWNQTCVDTQLKLHPVFKPVDAFHT